MNMPIQRLLNENYRRLELAGNAYLFHVPSTSLFELSQESTEALKGLETGTLHWSALDPQTAEEFSQLDLIGQPGKRHADVTIERFPAKALVLNVASGCNLSCTYCYKSDLTSMANGGNMTFDTAREAIDLFYAESPNRKEYTVTFFGGEPLGNLPLIRQVIAHAVSFFAARDAEVKFTMTTNATLLTPSVVRELHDSRVDLTISIDGPEAIHNRTRVFESGQGSYAAVIKNLSAVRSVYTDRVVAARVTLTRGITDVVGIWEHLHRTLGFREIGFAPATSGDNAIFNLTGNEIAEVFAAFKRLGEHYLQEAFENRYNGFSNLHRVLGDIHEGRKKRLPCGAGVGLISVSYKGTIDLCHRFTGSDFTTFGSVQTGLDKPALGRFLESRANDREGDCATCHIRNLCAGGCYHESYVRYGDPSLPVLHYCDIMRDWIDYALQAYIRISERNPLFFDTYFKKGEFTYETL
ncbi:MAG: quinohemoprotein amine dehydrogenase maturation protein [Sulfuricurvum sp.]